MGKDTSIEYKLKKIGELMGMSVFRVGVDIKNNKIDILSVSACIKDETADDKAIVRLPDDADYIG